MREKLRLISFILCICLMATACGNNSDVAENEAEAEVETDTEVVESGESDLPGGDVELTVWVAEEDEALINKLVSDFKAEYGSKANLTINIGYCPESDARDTVLDDVLNAADVFAFADDQLLALTASGILKPVEYNLEDIKSRNLESAISAATINEKLYAMPITADNGYFLYYNKQYFTDADLQTLDGILKVCAANGKKMTMDCTSGWYLYSFYGHTGLEVGVSDDGISNICTWNSTDNPITGVDVANALMAIGKNPGFLCGNDGDLTAGAANGSVIAGVSGTWLGTALGEAWGDNLGAVHLPTYTVAGQQVQMASYAGYKMLGVNSYSENRMWAECLADFMSNEENQMLRFEYRGSGPSNTNAAASDAVKSSPQITAVIAQSEFASLQRIGAAYWAPAGKLGSAMMTGNTGGVDLQEFLDSIVAGITASNAE